MPSINIQQWPAYVTKLGERAHAAALRGIVSGAARAARVMVQRTDEAPPASDHGKTGAVNTAYYRGRWFSRAIANGAMVYNDAKYASVIDRGRQAGRDMPPRSAIARWAQRRLGLSEKEAARAAFAIAAAIQRRGLKPRRVLSGATDQLGKVVREEVVREMRRELEGL